MAFWCRVHQSKQLKHLIYQFKRYYIQVPPLNYSVTDRGICAVEKPFSDFVKKPTDFCSNVRFFAAPIQAQPKKEEKDSNGPRMNDQIKAEFVRLVLDEGHIVVSRHEALERARKLKFDLVEVDRRADPPVCKIMDFHREEYRKEVKKKDLAKEKSNMTLRKGECKEVRFSGKIEQKDLKMKADSVKRLIERGYRVKCMAMPVSKKEGGEDLGGYLSRLLALVEDISIIESGPHVERRQAYALIRHVKFGPSKGSGKKSKVVEATTPVVSENDIPSSALCKENPAEFGSEDEALTDEADVPLPSPEMQNKTIENNRTARSLLNSRDDFNGMFDLNDDARGLTPSLTKKGMNSVPEMVHSPANFNLSNFSRPKPVLGSRADAFPSSPAEPSLGTENRYKRSEPRNQFQPTKSMDNREPVRDQVRSETQFPNQRRQPPPDIKVSSSMGERKQVGTDSSCFITKPHGNMPRQGSSRPNVPGNPAPSYGIFSNPTANAPGNPGTAGAGANPNGSQRPGVDNGGQAKWGIFSR